MTGQFSGHPSTRGRFCYTMRLIRGMRHLCVVTPFLYYSSVINMPTVTQLQSSGMLGQLACRTGCQDDILTSVLRYESYDMLSCLKTSVVTGLFVNDYAFTTYNLVSWFGLPFSLCSCKIAANMRECCSIINLIIHAYNFWVEI